MRLYSSERKSHQLIGNIVWVLIIALALWKYWVASGLPLMAKLDSPHDGVWFFKKALSIYQDVWMSETYDHMTLIKGPGYPLFLYLNSAFELNPRQTSDIFYIITCIVAFRALVRVGVNRFAAFLGYALLMLNPVTLSYSWQHILRFTLYLPLTLLFLSAILVVIVEALRDKENNPSFGYSLLAGISFALMAITREETIWAAPVLLLLLAAYIFQFRTHKNKGLIISFLVIIVPMFITNHWVSAKNKEHYGWYGIVELKEPNFKRAWQAIQSLNTAPSDGYDFADKRKNAELIITAETAEKLKQISPRTKEFVAMMFEDGEPNRIVDEFNYKVNATYAVWLVRDTVQKLGYYQDSATARDYYAALADDIEAYCQQESNRCVPMYTSMIFWREGHFKKFFHAIPYVWGELVGISKDYEPQYTHHGEFFGDYRYKYQVGRFFNARMQWDEELEKVSNPVGVAELKKYRRAKSNFESFHESFSTLFIAALVASVAILAWGVSLYYWASIAVLAAAMAAIFAINVLVAVTAYTEIARPLAAASAPMYLLCAVGIDAMIKLFMRVTEQLKLLRGRNERYAR